MKRLVAGEDEARPVEVQQQVQKQLVQAPSDVPVDVEAVREVMFFFLSPECRKRVTS